MNLPLTKDEASLVRYACNEMANKRAEQAIEAKINRAAEWAEANEQDSRLYRAIADRISQLAK